MTQRRCPKCESGVMSDMYTVRGWGKEGFYACDSCSHAINIYEGTTQGPYIFFILFEVLIFTLSNNISLGEYIIYIIVFVLLVYRLYKARMRDVTIASDYEVLESLEDTFEANAIQKESLETYMNKSLKVARRIKIAIALFVTLSYSIMFYFEENLSYVDYITYIVIAIILPAWLVLTKFKGE